MNLLSLQILPINELYACIQGEGMLAGYPHLLIRFTGCPLRCQWGSSLCDTPQSSWSAEKGGYTYLDVSDFLGSDGRVRHVMLTGGSPTSHPEALKKVYELAVQSKKLVTLETEGAHFVEGVSPFLLSLSPKLSNSTPKVGASIPGRLHSTISQAQVSQHNRMRTNYDAMRRWWYESKAVHRQMKFVIDGAANLQEQIAEAVEVMLTVGATLEDVWFMPAGATEEELQANRQIVYEAALQQRVNYTDRTQVTVYGSRRFV